MRRYCPSPTDKPHLLLWKRNTSDLFIYPFSLSLLLSHSLQRAVWEQQDPSDRKLPYVPMKFSSLRQVPAFPRFIHERFERCLDLYLCPRQRKMRVSLSGEIDTVTKKTQTWPCSDKVWGCYSCTNYSHGLEKYVLSRCECKWNQFNSSTRNMWFT